MTDREALKLALEALTHLHPTALTSFYTIGDRDKAITAIKEALAQPEQPPQRPWVGLNEDELNLIWLNCHGNCCLADGRILNYERAIEAKLKEKNT
jgi:hypothetical protein